MSTSLLMSPASASWNAMAAGLTGIEIPKGEPAALRRAATAWGHLGQGLDRQAQVIERGALMAALADWQGIASLAFESSARRLTVEMRRGARNCRVAGTACRGLATAIDDAQDEARAAIAEAMEALDRMKRAQRAIDRASADAAAADREAGEARAMGEIAKQVPAGLGAPGVEAAQRHEEAAQRAGQAARGRATVAREQLEDARRDLERARKRGRQANRHATEAGRHAAGVLHDVEHRAKGPARRTPPPLPALRNPPGVDRGLLDDLLATFNPKIGGERSIAPLGVDVDLGTRPSELADSALTAQAAAAVARAQDARAAAQRGIPAGSPLLRGPYADINRARAKAMADRHVKSGPGPKPPASVASKALRHAGRALSVLNPALQFRDNAKKDMPLLENTMRTGASAALGAQAAAAGATLCSPSTAGAAVCGVVAGTIGAKVGDFAGGAAYKAVDAGHQHVIKPLAGGVSDAAEAVEGAVSHGLGKLGIR